jgi:hypothetical protein
VTIQETCLAFCQFFSEFVELLQAVCVLFSILSCGSFQIRTFLTQVQATAQEEVAVELEGAALLRAVIASAHANALRIQQSTAAAASEQEERLQQQEDEVAERRRKVGLELRVIEEENAALRKKIDESTRGEVEEKEGLLEVKRRIEAELEELRAAVAEKERELAEQQGKVTEVEAKIAVVASKFGRELKGLQVGLVC